MGNKVPKSPHDSHMYHVWKVNFLPDLLAEAERWVEILEAS